MKLSIPLKTFNWLRKYIIVSYISLLVYEVPCAHTRLVTLYRTKSANFIPLKWFYKIYPVQHIKYCIRLMHQELTFLFLAIKIIDPMKYFQRTQETHSTSTTKDWTYYVGSTPPTVLSSHLLEWRDE